MKYAMIILYDFLLMFLLPYNFISSYVSASNSGAPGVEPMTPYLIALYFLVVSLILGAICGLKAQRFYIINLFLIAVCMTVLVLFAGLSVVAGIVVVFLSLPTFAITWPFGEE